MKEDNESFYADINPFLREIYEEASESDGHNHLTFLSDTEGRYCENELCGEGGMKKVFAADDNFSGRQIAMARLKEMKNSDSFLREVRLLARLEHPNIVPLYDVGLDESNEPYIIMKLLGGCRLCDIFQRMQSGEQKYDLPYLLEIFMKVCDATAYAHSKHIIHADIKPENIQIDDYGSVLLCDWGLACDLENEVVLSRRQSSGKAEGTPGSMAPEQLSDEFGPLSKKTDIYSLGCLLYSILSLKPPLAGESLKEVIDKTLVGDIPTVSSVAVMRVPRALAAVTEHAMSLQPSGRYDSVADFTDEIRSYMSGFATKAEDAGMIKKAALFYMRNQRSCSILAISIFAIFVIVLSFSGAVENSERLKNAALKEVQMEKSVKERLSKIAEEKLVSRANQEFKSFNIYKAKSTCEEALSLNLSSKPAHMLLGKIYFTLYRFEEAEKHFAKTDIEDFYYRKLAKKMISKELSGQKLIERMIESYNENAVHYQLPKVYKTMSTKERYKFLLKLIQMYRFGGEKVSDDSIAYNAKEGSLEISNMRLRSLAFISGLKLKSVAFKNCLINDCRILNYVDIESINLEGSLVKGIDELSTKETKSLNLSNTNILAHYFMEKQAKIEVIDLSYTELVWFSRILKQPTLKTLIVDKNQAKLSLFKKTQKKVQIKVRE